MNVLARVVRGLRENLYLHLVSAGVIATTLLLLGAFALAVVNVRALLGTWEQDAHVSAFFLDTVEPGAREALRAATSGRTEVAEVRLVTEEEARTWLLARSPELGPVLDELGPGALPASLEVQLVPGSANPQAVAAFAASLEQTGLFAEVDFGEEWVARVSTLLSLAVGFGVTLGGLLCLATLFLIGNTTHLVIHARRDELELMRLVGATDRFILLPFLAEGALQGVVGASAALATLFALYRVLLGGAAPLVQVAFGEGGVTFLSPPAVALVLFTGIALGVGAAWATVGRFLRSLP